MPVRFSAVVPCYNEEGNLPRLFSRFAETLAPGCEVIFVDNGSTDGTARVLETLLPRYPFSRVVSLSENKGYGAGILSGLKSAEGEFLGWTHGDLQCDPADFSLAVSLAEKNGLRRDLFIKGLRRGRPFSDGFFTVAMAAFESVYLRLPLWDVNAQPCLFHRAFFEAWPPAPQDFSLDLFALALALKKKSEIIRFPVSVSPRAAGYSSWNSGFFSRASLIRRTIASGARIKREIS